jgi:hypothetical protein
MLDLRHAADLARARVVARLTAAAKQKHGMLRSVDVIQRQSTFRTHLLDALRRSRDERQAPSPAPDPLFIAFPEKLLSRWYQLAYGPQREDGAKGVGDTDANLGTWRRWNALGEDTRFSNFERTAPKGVFLAHGLAPIWDSTLLLADIGRGFRAARALKVPLFAMVADVSWMSYNRSVRRFKLTDDAIEAGLIRCRDRRTRLYEALDIKHKIHAITAYEKKGSINSQKIKLIAKRYLQLVELVWGSAFVETEQPLSEQDLSRISKPLPQSLSHDSPLHPLAQFPNALHGLESSLKSHLDVIRTMAKRFRVLSMGTFSYYFAQYYAQSTYRGRYVKIAPISERDFDEPFDQLDDSFRAWGEGDKEDVSGAASTGKRVQLAAIYLPQYRLGKWELLPYTPLSLQAVTQAAGEPEVVERNVLMICDCDGKAVAKALQVVSDTLGGGAPQLNRLCADVLSFIAAFVSVRDRDLLDESSTELGTTFEKVLGRIDPALPDSFAIETEPGASWPDLWLSWLDAVGSSEPLAYLPSQILIGCKTEGDWSADAMEAAAELLLIANGIAYRLSGSG